MSDYDDDSVTNNLRDSANGTFVTLEDYLPLTVSEGVSLIAMGQYSSFCESAVVFNLGVVDIEDGVAGRDRVVWKRRGRRRRETGEGQKEDQQRSNTHHGRHEDGMKRAQTHGVARLEPCSEYAHV